MLKTREKIARAHGGIVFSFLLIGGKTGARYLSQSLRITITIASSTFVPYEFVIFDDRSYNSNRVVIYNLHTANKRTLHIIGFVTFNVRKPIV